MHVGALHPKPLYGLRSATSLCTLYVITVHRVLCVSSRNTVHDINIIIVNRSFFSGSFGRARADQRLNNSFCARGFFRFLFPSAPRNPVTQRISIQYRRRTRRSFSPHYPNIIPGFIIIIVDFFFYYYYYLLNDTRHDTTPAEENGGREILLY